MNEIAFIDAFEPVIAEQTRVMSAFIGSPSVDEDRGEFRRWWFSAMLVVAVHAAVAMAVLTWHITTKPLDPDMPPGVSPFFIDLVFIDLAPLPAARSPEESVLQPESGLDRGAVPSEQANNIPEVASTVNRDNSADAAALQRNEAEPRANGPIAEPIQSAPLAAVPPNNAEEDGGSAGSAASHAFAIGHTEGSSVDAAHAGRVDPGPIDTSNTFVPSLRQREVNIFDHNGMILLRPLRHVGKAEPLRNKPGAPTNARGEHGFDGYNSLSHGPGARIHDRVNAAIEREILRRVERDRNGSTVPGLNSLGIKSATSGAPPASAQGNAKNAIAATAASSAGDLKSGVINGTARNAIGMATQVHPSAHGINADERREGAAAAPPGSTGLTAAASATGVINGHNMVRPGMSLGVLGGPAKTVSGVLRGSDFRSKHQ